MAMQWLTELQGSDWSGSGELWLDPEGNDVDRCDCALRFETDALHYTWSYDGQTREGSFTFRGERGDLGRQLSSARAREVRRCA